MTFRYRSGLRVATVVAACSLLMPALSDAELTRVDVKTREDVLGGKPFGAAGPYERIIGVAYFSADPGNPRNQIIADLDKAPRNRQGRVEYSADIHILKPKDPSRGNGVLLFDVVNRGNKRLLSVFSRGRAGEPATEADFGDAWLLHEGYTLVAVGWQFDVPMGTARVGFQAPLATDQGEPLTGWVRMWFIPVEAAASFDYAAVSYNTTAYPPNDLADPQYRLTVREGIFSAPRLIPREQWRFARDAGGTPQADPRVISLEGGFRPGLTYEVAYETKNSPVAGLGLAAIRDVASAFKYSQDALAPGKYAYMYGASQTGRLIRQIVYEGFTIDEQERQAFDAAFVHTGGSSRGSFNERFAQPSELGSFTQTAFPILYKTTTDPVIGRADGLGARIPPGMEPKLFLVDTSSEYWDRGRVAALRHTSIDGEAGRDGRAERARVPHRGHAARSRGVSAGGGQRTVADQLQRLPVGAARPPGRARRVGPPRHGAAAEPSPHAGGRHARGASRFHLSRDPGRAGAGVRPRRLSRRPARPPVGVAAAGPEGRRGRE
jgi:hypothetical protein